MNPHVIDQLSAYLDGCAADPDKIAVHLENCAECAQRYRELLVLSAHLKTLPQPDVRPEFLTRVMANVREIDLTPHRPWWAQILLPTTVVVGLTVMIIAFAWLSYLTTDPSSPNVVQRPTSVLPSLPPPPAIARNGAVEELEEDEITPDDMLFALADEDWFRTLEDSLEDSSDFDSLLNSLDAQEVQALTELLQTYEMEDSWI